MGIGFRGRLNFEPFGNPSSFLPIMRSDRKRSKVCPTSSFVSYRSLSLIYAVIRPLSSLLVRHFPNLATTTERLGQAMINVAAAGYPASALESADINTAGATR